MRGAGMVVLNERIGDSEVGELRAVICLEEKTARITEYLRAQFPYTRERCLDSLARN